MFDYQATKLDLLELIYFFSSEKSLSLKYCSQFIKISTSLPHYLNFPN